MAPDVVCHLVAKDGGQHVFIGFATVVLRYLVEEAFENDYFASAGGKVVNNWGIYDCKFPIISEIGTLSNRVCDPMSDPVNRIDIDLVRAKLKILNFVITQ